MPVGALGGKKEIMEKLAPTGDIYQAGTLSGNPPAMSAGIATLRLLETKTDAFASLSEKADRLGCEMENLFSGRGIPVCVNKIYSMFTLFFQEGPVYDLQSALKSDTGLYARFFHGMIQNGVWLAPSQFEAGFISFAHTDQDMDRTLSALEKTLSRL